MARSRLHSREILPMRLEAFAHEKCSTKPRSNSSSLDVDNTFFNLHLVLSEVLSGLKKPRSISRAWQWRACTHGQWCNRSSQARQLAGSNAPVDLPARALSSAALGSVSFGEKKKEEVVNGNYGG